MRIINSVCHNKSNSDLYILTRNLLNHAFKLVFWFQIAILICALKLSIPEGYLEVENIVLNVDINACLITIWIKRG